MFLKTPSLEVELCSNYIFWCESVWLGTTPEHVLVQFSRRFLSSCLEKNDCFTQKIATICWLARVCLIFRLLYHSEWNTSFEF